MLLLTAVSTNANELESYKQRYRQLETRNQELQNKITEIETSHKQLYNEHLILKEQYGLLVYKRFVRSAEQLLADEKQPLLFTEEAPEAETTEEAKPAEFSQVKSFTRKKAGRRPISADVERRERIIDIPESEKTCACGEIGRASCRERV